MPLRKGLLLVFYSHSGIKGERLVSMVVREELQFAL
jgi:hypothetical protein